MTTHHYNQTDTITTTTHLWVAKKAEKNKVDINYSKLALSCESTYYCDRCAIES